MRNQRGGFAAITRSAFILATAMIAACAPAIPHGSAGSVATPSRPLVGPANGAVVVVGGGAMGPEIYRRFIELAGGPDAPIVVVPTAGGDSTYPADWVGLRGFQQAGATHVTLLHTIDRKEADSERFIEPLRAARGVWFPGGRQWHLVDSYLGTRTETAFRAVLERGGVIGGTSAGASILASYLVRGAREGNTVMMAPGYEQGFGYLRDVAIDQHVVARDRLADLPQVLARHPQLLGISEDEGTAWVVRGDQAEIIGRNKAFVYGGRDANDPGVPYLTLHPGDRYDLAQRHVTHRASDDSPLTAAFIDSLFADYTAPGAPGAAVLVALDGKILVDRGFGLADIVKGTPVTTRTNFRLASVTKQFTAAATMLLVKDGKLRLDETLADVWPDFPAYGRRITIRHLLTHTSGLLAYEDFVPDSQVRQVKDAEIVTMMKRADSTLFAPGTRFEYSNTGYVLLGEIVAKRSGMPFATFLRNRIFVPLGMHKTIAREDAGPAVAFRAYGHSFANGAWAQTDQSNTSATLGDGGIYTSVDELYRWDQALYTDELLPPPARAQLFTDNPLADGKKTGYGFGWYVDPYRGLPRTYHTGESRGFRNVIMRFPTMRATIIILTNRSAPSPEALARTIADRLLFTKGDARWRKQPIASASSCRSLSAVSETVAWAGCSGGHVYRTTDGARWSVHTVPGAARLDFRGIKAFDANTAVVTSAGPAEEGQARIYRTTDGARTWTLAWSDTTKGIFLDGLAFWDAKHGFTFSDPIDGKFVILTTGDGGATWQRVDPANIPPVIPGEAAFAASNTQLTVQGDRNAWIATGGGKEARVFRTTDRGRTWEVHGTGMPGGASAGLFGIAFADPRNGLAVGGDYAIARGTDFAIRTTDGGITWTKSDLGRPDGATQGLTYIPGSNPVTFVGAGAWGTTMSSDFGATWQHGDTLTAWGIGFASPRVGWVVGPRGHLSRFDGTSK